MSEDGHNYTFGGWPEMPWKRIRNYHYIDGYLNELLEDVYPQPPDVGHTEQAMAVIDKWIPVIKPENVLDVGCGEAFCQPMFEYHGVEYRGVSLGEDFEKAKKIGRNVLDEDFHFLPDGENAYDLIFARHALEHSPMPILALMEWHRVGKKYLILVLPKPKFWMFLGRNHYSVVTASQARFLLHRSGWTIIEEDHDHEWEYRFLCGKGRRSFNPDEGYLWAYKDEDLSWLYMAEPEKEEEEEVLEVVEA
jgi:hypothetical protein